MSYSFIRVSPGTKIRTSVQVRGQGRFRFELSNYYAANKRWVRPNTFSPDYKVDSAEWKEFSFESTVSDQESADGKIGWLRFVLLIHKDSALEFDGCHIEPVK